MLSLMTHDEFTAELAGLGLSQTDFRRILERLSGDEVAVTTVNRWATGKRSVPASAAAVVRLLGMLPAAKRAKLARKDEHNGDS